MSSTRTAETPRLDQASRWASSPMVAGPRLPQTILAPATQHRELGDREILRKVGGLAIAENIPLETLAEEARVETTSLRRALCDPGFDISEIMGALRKLVEKRERLVESETFVSTRISAIVEDVLEQAADERMLSVINGDYRTGKSHAARRWNKLHQNCSVYIEVPAGINKCVFLRELGAAFGLGTSTAVKVAMIEWKIRRLCREWRGVIILDEAHRLWNEDARHEPQRIEMVRDLVSPQVGASVVCIATNQFANAQRRAELSSKTWGSGQWVGRIGRYEELPPRLSDTELHKVAKAHLPHASEKMLGAVVDFAVFSDGMLGSIEHAAKMAQYLARKDKREMTNTHISKAIQALLATTQAGRAKMKELKGET